MTEQFIGYTTGGIDKSTGDWTVAQALVGDRDELIDYVKEALNLEQVGEEEYNIIGPVSLVAVYALRPVPWSELFPKAEEEEDVD